MELPHDNRKRSFEEMEATCIDRSLISLIIPVKNCSLFLDECFGSILDQSIIKSPPKNLSFKYKDLLEVSIFDDYSTDSSPDIIESWIPKFQSSGIKVSFHRGKDESKSDDGKLKTGCGYAKNRAVSYSTGHFLCFQDADDVMLEKRIELQLEACLKRPEALIGSNFVREPADATPRFTDWCNRLTEEDLVKQQYRECTIAQPTWFCTRDLYDRVGGYDESGPGTPEDLIFFHKHLDLKGQLYKVDEALIKYRYHKSATSHSIHRLKLLDLRASAFERRVLSLPNWDKFMIWGAGRDGRKFFGAISLENRKKMIGFCDVDEKKIGTNYFQAYTNLTRPIVHFSEAKPPLVICVAMDRTGGELEKNLKSLNLVEGVDYFHFN